MTNLRVTTGPSTGRTISITMSHRYRFAAVARPGPRDSVIAVVGDGFGSVVHGTARYLGFENREITIFGPSDNPVATYQQFAYNLGQTVLRP
jgi:hypothetical protein